jgi:integrase
MAHCDQQRLRVVASTPISEELVDRVRHLTNTSFPAGCDRAALSARLATGTTSGVHIKAVADLLGHSSIAITGDVYGHTSDDTARAAVDGLAGRLGL